MSTDTWQQLPPPDVSDRADRVWRWEIHRPAQLTAARGSLRDDLVGDALPDGADADDVDRLMLAFEELASNGLRHSGQPIMVTVTGCSGGWLVDVSDARPDSPPVPAVDRDPALGGLGLYLIARLAAAHGWVADGARKQVWACITPRRRLIHVRIPARPCAAPPRADAAITARRVHNGKTAAPPGRGGRLRPR
jgi:anti-sigma regulatory factor (Ser/Thr protein kinase)